MPWRKKKTSSEQSQENLKKAAEAWNKKTQAQKKAERKWGKKK